MAPVDWSKRWTEEARVRQPPGLLSAISSFSAVPGGIGMHGGLPHPKTFPFEEINFQSKTSGEDTILMDKAADEAQQYIFRAHGYAPLLELLENLNRHLHKPHNKVTSALTNGATQAIDCIVNLLLYRGDALLCEEFCYSHALEAQFVPRGFELVPISMDAEGLDPRVMDAVLTERQAAGLKLPTVLYTIPRGQNPTGASMSMKRLADLYEVAQKWDIVVIEDDAYYWLQQPEEEGGAAQGLNLEPGLLSMDVDGRVIRIDTLSKLLGPGFRLGWVTAVPEVTDKIALAAFSSSMGAASLSQISVFKLLSQWGIEGLDKFVKETQQHYTALAAKHDSAAKKYLAEVASWERPRSGMFMWIKLQGAVDSSDLLAACLKHGVMIVPGSSFWAGGIASSKQEGLVTPPCPYFRISYATLGEDFIEEGYRRLRAAIDEVIPLMNNNSQQGMDGNILGWDDQDDLAVGDLEELLQQQAEMLPDLQPVGQSTGFSNHRRGERSLSALHSDDGTHLPGGCMNTPSRLGPNKKQVATGGLQDLDRRGRHNIPKAPRLWNGICAIKGKKFMNVLRNLIGRRI